MNTSAAIDVEVPIERYAALIRAANVIANCSDCDNAGDVLARELGNIIAFDYLHLVVFESGTKEISWRLLYANGERKNAPLADDVYHGTTIEWLDESQKALVTPDWAEETRFPTHRSFLSGFGIRSTYTLPLVRKDRRLGVVEFGRAVPHAYSEEECRFLDLVADQLALAIDAAVSSYLSQQAELDLTNQIVSNLDFPELLRAISASVRRVMHCDADAIMLPDPDGKQLRVHALDFPASRGFFKESSTIPIDASMPGETFKTGTPLIINRLDPATVPREIYAKASGEGMNSFCDVALVSHGRMFGVLAVARREENTFDGREVAFLSQVAKQVAIAIENAQSYGEISDLKDRLAQEKLYLEDEIRGELDFEGIVGQSSGLRHVLTLVETVAPSDSTVLLLGETGTGKELIARAIHDRSRREDRNFVKLNCAAIPSGLLESELFGHERGAFTGAISQKIGRLELAEQGSLFLDEIGDIPLELQPKLLRVLQEREFERLGSTRTKKVNVRVVAATHRNMEEMILEKQFRSDLYYRLNIFPISLPPLRERPEDIPVLAWHFVRLFAQRMNKAIDVISHEAMQALTRYSWPGNIRELQNVIERSVVVSQNGDLSVKKSWLSRESSPTELATPPRFKRSAMEDREMICATLAEARGRVSGPSGAAAMLGIPPSTLESKIRAMNINKYQFRVAG